MLLAALPTHEDMRLVNLTPHAIHLGALTIHPSGTVARVEHDEREMGTLTVDGERVTVRVRSARRVSALPPPADGVYYIVSSLVLDALAELGQERRDLLCPDRLLRDERGRVTGCAGLVMRASALDVETTSSWQTRLVDEFVALDERLHRLREAIRARAVPAEALPLLRLQVAAMSEYHAILEERVDALPWESRRAR